MMLLLCPPQSKGTGVLPARRGVTPCAEPPGKGPEAAVSGHGSPARRGQAERRRRAWRHARPSKQKQPAAPAPCLLPRGRQESKGQCRAGAQQEGLRRDSPSSWAVAPPARYRPTCN